MSILTNHPHQDSSSSIVYINDDFHASCVYLLWTSNIDEEFKIQALFGKALKYDLVPKTRFRNDHRQETVVYQLKYEIPIDNNEYAQVCNENNNSTMNRYQFKMSTDYDDPKQRIININIPHQFLFDVHFQSQSLKSTNGSPVDIWCQLCLYTYFLIQNNMCDEFDRFITQFVQEFNINDPQKLSQHQLNMFFYVSSTYLPQITSDLRKNCVTIKIFLQMFGLLPINKENFKVDNHSLSSLVSEVYDYIKIHLQELLRTMENSDWTLFIKGLTIFMSRHMLGSQTTFNTFVILEKMIDNREKQECIVNLLLRRLIELRMPIKCGDWTILFSLATDKHLLYDCLDLVTSFDDYLTVLQHVIRNNSTNEQMVSQLTKNVDRLISRPDFLISFDNILTLMTYLQPQRSTTGSSSTKNRTIFQSIITSSNLLPDKINICLENIDISQVSLELIHELFQLDHFASVLKIDKINYLIKTIEKQPNRTEHFYTTWFICFLCNKYYAITGNDQQNFQRLLDVWLHYITIDRDMLPQIIAKLDILIEHLQAVLVDNNDNRLTQFIENMLNACFEPNVIYQLLNDMCAKVTNKSFLELYQKKFIDDLLIKNENRLKLMDDPINPLNHLLKSSKIIDPTKNMLLSNLITACTKLIKLNYEEIHYQTFVHPTKNTCTYAVLFDQYINDFALCQRTLKQLDDLWNRWMRIGLITSDIDIWKNHTIDEKSVFRQIWKRIEQHFNKQDLTDTIFKEAELEFENKIKIREAIITSLNMYCEKANDYKHALISLRNMLHEFDQKPIRSVEIPKALQDIERIASRLYPFSTSQVWLNFYNQSLIKTDEKDLRSNSYSRPLVHPISFGSADEDDDCASKKAFSMSAPANRSVGKFPWSKRETVVSYDASTSVLNTGHSIQPTRENLTSAEILKHVIECFEQFNGHLIHIYTHWKKETIQQWIQFFTDIKDINLELEILKSNLNLNFSVELINLLHLWKSRNFIYDTCQGCLNLITQLQIHVENDDLNILNTLVQLDENILGENCSFVYQQYLEQYVQQYSSNALVVWSQYSIANELIEFIVSVSATDFDILLETVRDGDNKLVSAQTVMNFIKLNHYFDLVYKSIKHLRRNQNSSSLHNVLACFDSVEMNTQFDNIEEFFATCSNELSDMRQSYSELTDKEKTKRRQIMNIMKNSSMIFTQNETGPIQFDVLLIAQNVHSSNLTELRDRARLIEYTYSNKMKKDDEYQMEQFKSFILFVNIIETILNTLTSLYIAGHPMVSKIISSKEIFSYNEHQLENFSTQVKEILFLWENTLCRKYILYPELTYFSCKQFDMIEQFIFKENKCDEQEQEYGYHLLKYIGLEPGLIRQLNLPRETKPSAEDRLESVGQILSRQRSLSQPLSRESRTTKKIFLVETTNEGILRAVLSFCDQFKILPCVNHLFYCTNETNSMQIRAFIYRCIYSQECYQLIRPERLSISIQAQIVYLFKQLIENEPQHLFHLSIITTIPIVKLQLIDGLKSLQIVQTIPEQDLMNNIDFRTTVSNLIQGCTLVTSRITGLGKSHMIREECLKSGKEYIKFPINGDIQADLIAKRLLAEAHKFEKGVIHFDIGVIDNCHQLNDLINCLILFRSFCFGQIAVSIPTKTPIYIELDCSPFSNLIERIVLFQYIPTIFIDRINWNKFIITEPVQFVGNYLKAIKDTTIIKKDITTENVGVLQRNECEDLIKKFFINDKDAEYVTWTQLFIYISIFYKLFMGFSKCSFFQSNLLQNSKLQQSRMDILQTFLKTANQFTSKSVEAVRQQQRAVNSQKTQQKELSNAVIRWDKTEPFTLIFSPTYDPIVVYKTEKDIPESLKNYYDLYNQKIDSKQSSNKKTVSSNEYRMISGKTIFPDYKQLKHEEFFQKLAALSLKYLNKAICTKCFRQYDYDTLTCTTCLNTTDLLEKPAPPLNNEDIKSFQKRIAKIIEAEYVLTADNYIKMLLVFLRVQSGVPVLIMGETGCGKTALINCLCRKILDDDFYVFRLHAGITDENLIGRMNILIIQADNLPPEKRLWIFFDEFNTIFNVSLLKEIICERTLLGRTLPKNMVFLGTCNPRRQKTDKAIFDENVGIKIDCYDQSNLAHHRSNLFYEVTQIPETMLEYVWDYGQLDLETEKTYIEATLKTCEGLSNDTKWFKTIIELISESHVFLRKLEDVSSVSLRDVARYCRLFKWFNQYLLNRDDIYHADDFLSLIQRASLLALLLCYYFRLDSKPKKEDYLQILDNRLCPIYKQAKMYFVHYLERLLDREQIKLINQMHLPKDMALNRALKENIFVLFSCIMNRIPVFLCGKPGASKTSAVQILMNNLKGLRSDNIYFRKFPELAAVTFQGSRNCTSKNIEQVFQRAEKYLKTETNSSLLPVIILDEIGLAEQSIHNPLKVLHEQLEIEECRFGFVGISNWRLDASKMNRALYIACIDPDDKDLESTGIFLSKLTLVSDQIIQLDLNIIRGLAQVYFDLQKAMKKQHKYENYFGLRDYYSLIKGIVRECQKNSQNSQYEIIYQQLVINFGSNNDRYQYMWRRFCSLINRDDLIEQYPKPSPQELIDQSLTNRNSRHLMLIVDRESTIDHVERYITTNPIVNGSVRTLVGSRFEGDFISHGIYTESYTTRVLMEIILHAETPITLVMRQMNHLYENLYDLFNQNFARSNRNKYCRIALSSIYNPHCLIHDNFYCVILLNAKDVDISDPPFLNRFEKQYIQIDKLIQPRQWSLTLQLLNWSLKFPLPSFSEHFPLLKHMIIPYSPDYICDLVIDICDDNDLTDEIILNSCKAKFIRACSFDFPLVLSLNINNSKENELLIDQYYHIHYELFNIARLISSTFEQSFSTKRIIYTYTHIYDTIDYENTEQIREIKLSNIKTELELINLLKTYAQNEDSSFILIIRVDYHLENQHILSLKYNIQNQWNELKKLNLWIIFHVQRNKINQTTNDVLFNGWDIIMIDDLNNKNKFISKEILNNPSYENFLHEYQVKLLEDLFDEFIHRGLSKIRYQIISNEQQIERHNYLFEILTNMNENSLRQILQQTIEYLIKTISSPNQTRFQDWRVDLLSDKYITVTSRSVNEAVQSIMVLFYDNYFQLLFYHFERFNLFDSYIYLQQDQSIDLKHLWSDCYKLSLNKIDNTMMNVRPIGIRLITDLKLPFSVKENQILQQIKKRLAETVDDDLELFLKNLLKEKSTYGRTLIDLVLSNNDLLNLYYHDQLILFHMENNFQLSTKLTLKLMTTNTKINTMTRIIQLLAYPNELTEILNIFEDGFKLLDENSLLEIMNKQLHMMSYSTDVCNSFYSLIFKNEHFYILPPNTLQINEKFKFDPLVDPFIEISLMNLLELIVCPVFIGHIHDIDLITTLFNSIIQSVLKLTPYKVTNLQKLSSLMSLLRCIKTLNPSQALEIFQKCCRDDKFDASFQSCDDIHNFIENLEEYILQQHYVTDQTSIKSTLLKLEVEFLKNCLRDHDDQYTKVLDLINQTENNLWKYSAKILSDIVKEKCDLLSNIERSYDQLPEKLDEINQLEDQFDSSPESSFKIHRLFVNRMHLDLILRSSIDDNSIKEILDNHYDSFEESIQAAVDLDMTMPSDDFRHIKLIRLLSWIKYYSQIYSFSLFHNVKFNHINDIDHYLTTNKLSFCSTLKLFIFKQIFNLTKLDLTTFRSNFKSRNITWLNEFLEKIDEDKTKNERNIIVPIPSLNIQDEYSRVNKVLSDFTDKSLIEGLIFDCSINQYLSYCFYLWFIKYYTQYSTKIFPTNDHYHSLFQGDLSDQSKNYFQPIGIHFLHMLCTNFTSKSYFHLNSSMSDRAVSIRLVILNIMAVTLSFKSFPETNWINTILFNTNLNMPENYFEHLQSTCLFGLIDNDRILSNMTHVRASVQQRLNSGHLTAAGKYIYQCSKDCLYLFHFTHRKIPSKKSQCLFCQKQIGLTKHGILIERNPPQIRMTVDKGFQLIDEYIEASNRENTYGYHHVILPNESTIEQKPDHLNSSVSYRFLHLFIHSILFALQEFGYLSIDNLRQWNIDSQSYFQDHVEKDYELLEKCTSDPQSCYVWLFQLFNGMLDGFEEPLGSLDSKEKVIRLEQLVEKQLVIPHSVSKVEEINKYKRVYTDYAHKEETDNTLISFIDERTENNQRYPYLNFFNITQIFSQDQTEEFLLNLKTMSHARINYPLTMYLLEHIDDWNNIQYLHPIIQFLNYLRDKYNYRVSRQQAVSKSIQECLNDSEGNKGEDLFKEFRTAWSKINLKQVRYGCQERSFDKNISKEKKLAFFSLNTTRDDSSLILSATLQTIAKLQNTIVKYFHNEVVQSIDSNKIRHLPIHTIKPEHLFCLNKDFINSKIIEHALVINFEYGQSKDIIYDYEEIEMTLRSAMTRLPLLDIDSFPKLQFQFEVYSENTALINDVRQHVKQQQFNDDRRRQYRSILQDKDNNDILQYLGSLDYIFTYIQNRYYQSNISTIELFVHQYIHSNLFLNQNLFLQSIFSSIHLEYIIALYELIEEMAFDKNFRKYIEEKLNDQIITIDQRAMIQQQFSQMIIDNRQVPPVLQNIHHWISTLKRFMVRILRDDVDLNVPLEIYLKRTDLWNGQVTEDDLDSIKLDETIVLKHTHIILIGLENRLSDVHEQQTSPITIQPIKRERQRVSSFEISKSPNQVSPKGLPKRTPTRTPNS